MAGIFNKPQEPEIPVYLFTGFLEAGKTTFINETLCDERFGDDGITLLLSCEDGVEELDEEGFVCPVVRRSITQDELNSRHLAKIQKEHKASRVFIEYNGMWQLDLLYRTMPKNWSVCQEFMFADASTFQVYNANMRNLVFDKLQSCELAVFNRMTALTDTMALHKLVRAVNRSCDIAYEYTDGHVEFDAIVDPLPFDINASVIEIGDDDYAVWYRDLGEELTKYDGKTVSVKGMVSLSDELPEGTFIIGRPLMNCCADDIMFAGMIVEGQHNNPLKPGDWITLTADIEIKEHKAYEKEGPVLALKSFDTVSPPENEVASF